MYFVLFFQSTIFFFFHKHDCQTKKKTEAKLVPNIMLPSFRTQCVHVAYPFRVNVMNDKSDEHVVIAIDKDKSAPTANA